MMRRTNFGDLSIALVRRLFFGEIMVIKNNVTRLLDSRKVAYKTFSLPPEKRGAVETARLLDVLPELVFKTIVVVRTSGKPILALVPGSYTADLKAVAKALGEKKVSLPTQAEAEKLTALQAGGISPLALLNKGFTVLLDLSARKHEHVHISGGQRGLNIRLRVDDLVKLTKAHVVQISKVA